MMNSKLFTERLRQARKDAGMTMMQVAFTLYTDQSVISRYENGEICPRIDRVIDFAKLYGVSMDWLCGMEGRNDKNT